MRKRLSPDQFRCSVSEWPGLFADLMSENPPPEKLSLVASVCRDEQKKLLLPTPEERSTAVSTISALELFAQKAVEERRKLRAAQAPFIPRERFRVA